MIIITICPNKKHGQITVISRFIKVPIKSMENNIMMWYLEVARQMEFTCWFLLGDPLVLLEPGIQWGYSGDTLYPHFSNMTCLQNWTKVTSTHFLQCKHFNKRLLRFDTPSFVFSLSHFCFFNSSISISIIVDDNTMENFSNCTNIPVYKVIF